MNYRVWLPEQGETVEDSKFIRVNFGTYEDAAVEFLERFWHDYDQIPPPFKIAVVEAGNDKKAFPDQKPKIFEFTEVDYRPIFYVAEVKESE